MIKGGNKNKMKREDVYKLIDEERDYQDRKWAAQKGHPHPKSDFDLAIADWLIYIERVLSKAKDRIYYLKEAEALDEVRKIAAVCVACMENNETPPRLPSVRTVGHYVRD